VPALIFAAFLAVVAVSAAAIFVGRIGRGVEDVARYYRGDEASYVPAKSVDGLLLVAVPHLVAIPLALFAASHVVGWARLLSARAWRAIVALSFGGGALTIAGSFAVRFVAPEMAWLKAIAFVGAEAGLLAWVALLVRLFLPRATARSRRS
jgi:hypothetical protein